MDHEQVLRLLGEQEAAGWAEMVRLEQEAARIAGLVEECRREVDRLAVAREVVSGLVVGPVGVVSVGSDAKSDALMEQLLAVLVEAGRPMRCRDVVAALGDDPLVARNVERVRHWLKKLVVAGRVTEREPGLFTVAGDCAPSPG